MAKRDFKLQRAKDTARPTKIPGVGEQVALSFDVIMKDWRNFILLVVCGVLAIFLLVGTNFVFSETNYVFATIIFLVVWLVAIYFARHVVAKKKVNFRDGLFNAMGPLMATFVIFVVAVIECVPVVLAVIAHSAASATGFLNEPFYTGLLLGFDVLMVLITGYLLPTTFVALVAVTAPGIYPIQALRSVSELMMGRKKDLICRLVVLCLVLCLVWVMVILPVVALKLPEMVRIFVMAILTCFSIIYIATYLYIYYRFVIE
ncbi:hypothetical protein IJG28_02490 [Candidatus Saccharibacteria bacterium]|nr:hypothetical protein [Candidatus Saccharibacteria bacterium]